MNSLYQDGRPEDEDAPNKFSELNRRGFLIAAAATVASTMIGCSPMQSNLAGGNKKWSTRIGNRSHKTYKSYLESLRLGRIAPDSVIEPHFRTRSGVRNSLPPKSLWKSMAPTLRVADQIAKRTGSPLDEVCSAYRSPTYNSRIGGASKSQHMRNTALDLKFECGSWAASKAARQLRSEGLFAGGIGIYNGFLHIDTRGANETWWG